MECMEANGELTSEGFRAATFAALIKQGVSESVAQRLADSAVARKSNGDAYVRDHYRRAARKLRVDYALAALGVLVTAVWFSPVVSRLFASGLGWGGMIMIGCGAVFAAAATFRFVALSRALEYERAMEPSAPRFDARDADFYAAIVARTMTPEGRLPVADSAHLTAQ